MMTIDLIADLIKFDEEGNNVMLQTLGRATKERVPWPAASAEFGGTTCNSVLLRMTFQKYKVFFAFNYAKPVFFIKI